jgi:ribonuclease HI
VESLTPERFDESLDLLENPLRDRAAALRPFVTRADQYSDMAEAIGLAFDAAFAGDQRAAQEMLTRVEALASSRSSRAAEPRSSANPRTIINRGLRGQVPGHDESGPVVVATDGSWKGKVAGWGYLSTCGRWGCAGAPFSGRLDPTGQSGAMIAEFRAVHMALADLAGNLPLTLLIDSQAAIGYLNAWQSGQTGRMPEGYSLRPRLNREREAGKPTLVQLAEMTAARPDLIFRHVGGHIGHPLNEAADALAGMARRCVAGERTGDEASLAAHAGDLAVAFLNAWRGSGRGTA